MSAKGGGQGGAAPETKVLIVGAGPAGLFAASELLRHGVRPRIVERRPAPHHDTRGTAIQPAVLETLDKGGVIAPFLESSLRIREIELLGPGLKQIALTKLGGLGCEYEFQCSQPQWFTEQVLRDHLASRGLEVEFGIETTAIAEDSDGLSVTLVKNGRAETLRADYLVGADGAHGPVRHSMQEHLDGETYGGRYIVADVKLGLSRPPGRGRVVFGPAGFVLLSPLPDERWLIFVNRDDGDERSEPPGAAELGALVNARVGTDAGLADLRWISYFRMHRRTAPRLGDGRRFLLGDSGHLSSPMGGEGINSALMDAADIGWKLGYVVGGAAKPSLLQTYAIERGLADQRSLQVTNDIHNFVMNIVAMCKTGEPSVPPEEPAAALAGLRSRSMLDISYAGSPVIGPADPQSANPPVGERYALWTRLEGTSHHLVLDRDPPWLDEFRARWGGVVTIAPGTPGAAGLTLVRPDGFIAFHASAADGAAMKALDAHLATYLTAGFVAKPAQARQAM